MQRRGFLLLLLGLATAWISPEVEAAQRPVGSQGGPSWCGTHISGLAIAEARHRKFQRRLARERRLEAEAGVSDQVGGRLSAGPTVTKVGNLAVIEVDTTLVSDVNLFDLDNGAVQFKRRGKKLRAVSSSAVVNSDVGTLVQIGDDDTVILDLPFNFRFYGRRYSRVFLNSDGNLTFEEGDKESTPRSLARFLNGPPRIAPFFADLDPSQALAGGGVFVNSSPSRVRITWLDVPEFDKSTLNTVQVTLFPRGRIAMAYGELAAKEGIVGTSPGDVAPVALIDFTSDLPFGPVGSAIAERFSLSPQVDDVAVAQVFFQHFRDIYDHLIVWVDFPVSLEDAFAFELTVKNDVRGIGLRLFDFSDLLGSDSRLESYVQMGSLRRYPANPNQTFLETNSTLDILGQETGHRWLAFVRFRDRDGVVSSDLLGRGMPPSHWSFHHDTDASVMEGNDIVDNGDGTFLTVDATSRFSPLDRYLMGLIPPQEVPDFFYVGNATGASQDSAPEIDVTIRGLRIDVSVDDVIAAEGEREPASEEARKKFKMAFVLLAQEGKPPSEASIDQVNRIRKRWRSFFRQATGRNGKVATNLRAKPN
ncbi:MAG: hypothetical protein V3T81_08835 [Thermoanaerobaculia bacterium]